MNLSQLNNLVNQIEKWLIIAFACLQTAYALLILKQIVLLDQFIPTLGGKLLKLFAALYALATALLVIGAITLI